MVIVTQGVKNYSTIIMQATTLLQRITFIVDFISLGFSVNDWLSGDEKMKEEVEKQVSELTLVTNAIRTTCDKLEKFVKSIEDQKSIINLQLFNVDIYKQIMNIYPRSETHFRLMNEYKHIIGFKYKYMEKALIMKHFEILQNVSNSEDQNSVSLLKELINSLKNVKIKY